jgi:adenine phosphoribosyltransferase
MNSIELRRYVRDIPNFPKPGILFRDVTPLLADRAALPAAVEALAAPFRKEGIEQVLGIESRGFVLGAAVALALGAGFTLVRKQGKLPYETRSVTYDLEYGTDTVEMHVDAVKPGERVLIVDDLIAPAHRSRRREGARSRCAGGVRGLPSWQPAVAACSPSASTCDGVLRQFYDPPRRPCSQMDRAASPKPFVVG